VNGKIRSDAADFSLLFCGFFLICLTKISTGPFMLHPGIVFCTAEQMYALDKGAVAFPISML
jgi:hypothetical protein